MKEERNCARIVGLKRAEHISTHHIGEHHQLPSIGRSTIHFALICIDSTRRLLFGVPQALSYPEASESPGRPDFSRFMGVPSMSMTWPPSASPPQRRGRAPSCQARP
jgi:hypothetical protein